MTVTLKLISAVEKRLSQRMLVSTFASANAKKRWNKEGTFLYQVHSGSDRSAPLDYFNALSSAETDQKERFQLLELPGGIFYG